MIFKRVIAASVALLTLAACNDTPVGITSRPARFRIVNVTFQTTDATNTASTATPRAIDFLFDSSTATPSTLNIAPNGIYPAQGATPADNYAPLDIGLHQFFPRLASGTPTTSLYGNGANPADAQRIRLYFTGDTYYTILVAGIAPSSGYPAKNAFFDVTSFNAEFPLLDDNTPPTKDLNGAYQTRFRLVHAAPMGDNSINGLGTISLYVTPGATAPTAAELGTLRVNLRSDYRLQTLASSTALKYETVPPGTYWATATATVGGVRTIVAQQQVTLGSGEVNTFLVTSTGYAAQASTANTQMRVLLDAKY